MRHGTMATPQQSHDSDPKEESSRDSLCNPLMQPCSTGDSATLQDLLQQDDITSLITEPGKDGYAPIHCAAHNNHKHIIELLLATRPCTVDQPSQRRETALHIACMRGHVELADYLINEGANPMALTTRGNTPLHYAATSDCAELVEMLLRMRVVKTHIDETNTAGQTAAELATTLGCVHTVRVLRQHRANFQLKNSRDYSAVDVANSLGNTECHAIATEPVSSITCSLPCTPGSNTPVHDHSHSRSLPASVTSPRHHMHTGTTTSTPKYSGIPSLDVPTPQAHSGIFKRRKYQTSSSQSTPSTPANRSKAATPSTPANRSKAATPSTPANRSKAATPSTPANRSKAATPSTPANRATGTSVKHEDGQSEDKHDQQ